MVGLLRGIKHYLSEVVHLIILRIHTQVSGEGGTYRLYRTRVLQ